jgi:hypothetical protein
MTTSREVMEAYRHAVSLGAVDSYDDCIGGSIRAPYGATQECENAVAEYRYKEIDLYRQTTGRALRMYYAAGGGRGSAGRTGVWMVCD